ncbi:MAG TPA: hypothetical protein VF216_00040 [Mizugakiibacter sp.]
MAAPMPPAEPAPPRARVRRRNWDALAAVVAALIGFLALLVSGYTAYIQRQQVRAQVWPYLTKAYVDPADSAGALHKLAIFNKGVGPAIVHGVQVLVDGKPQRDWKHVLEALDLSSLQFGYTTLDGNVISAGETLPALVFPDQQSLARFRQAMSARADVRICYCSTLGECWLRTDRGRHGEAEVQSIAACPRWSPAETFAN